jgi:hypothetical protein
MADTHQVAVAAGRIDDDEVEAALDPADRLGKSAKLAALQIGHAVIAATVGERDGEMRRELERQAGALAPQRPVLDIARRERRPSCRSRRPSGRT